MLTTKQFEHLARSRGGHRVSIYLPTHRTGRDVREDPIRLRNLLRDARQRAEEAGFPHGVADRVLAPVEALFDDELFWQHLGDGLALFADEESMAVHRLPHPVDELAAAGSRFVVRPLLPGVDTGETFFVLALSQNRVRLFLASRQSIREIDHEDIPDSLADALGYDWEQKSLQFHTRAPDRGGPRDAMFHGQGRGSDEDDDELETFLHRVDDGVMALLRSHPAPLVVAAVERIGVAFRKITTHPQVVEPMVEGNPDTWDPDQLHERALDAVRPQLDAVVDQRLAQLHDALHTPLGSTDLDTVVEATRNARVGVLLVAHGAPRWGRREDGTAEVHDERRAGDEDLLDRAVADAVAAGAEVFAVDADRLPDQKPVGAVMRFEA